jgi:hypothetical protein
MANDHLNADRLALLAVTGGEEPAHLAGCARCAAELEDLKAVVAHLRALPEAPAHLIDAAKEYYRRRRRFETLVERLSEDPRLRERARSSPEEVLRELGIDPVPALIEALRETARPRAGLAPRLAAKAFWR